MSTELEEILKSKLPFEKETVTMTQLAPTSDGPVEIQNIPVPEIEFMPYQPRTHVALEKILELADSIAAVGQQQAGKVRPIDPPNEKSQKWQLISGERRLRACIMANVGFFRAEIDRTPMTPAQQFVRALTCNSDMEPLSVTENALAIQRLKSMQLTDANICKIMSRSIAWVTQHYSLLKLTPKVFSMMGPDVSEEKRLGLGLGLLLIDVPDDYQIALANEIAEHKLSMTKARHVIKLTLAQRGIKRKAGRPGREFSVFAGFIERTDEQLKMFLETPLPMLRAMLADAGSLQERMRVLETLEQVAEDVPELKELVESIVKRSDADRIQARITMVERLVGMAKGFPELKDKLEAILRDRISKQP